MSEHDSEVDDAPNLVDITQKLKDQMTVLDEMSVENYDSILKDFSKLFEEVSTVSENYAREYIENATTIEDALNTLSEYNRKALEQLNKITMEEINAISEENDSTAQKGSKAGEAMVERAKLLLKMAEQQLEYSKHIGNVTRPLMAWRLDASKAVWEAQEALKLAESKLAEAKEKDELRAKNKAAVVTPAEASENEIDEEEENQVGEEQLRPSQIKTPVPEPEDLDSAVIEEEDDAPGINVEELMSKKRQPIKFWPKLVYYDDDGEMICYIRAPSDCLEQQEYVQCTFANANAPWPIIPGQYDLIGKYVSLCPVAKKRICILPNEPWIIGIPHNYVKVASRETVLFALDSGPNGVPALEKDPKEVKQSDLVNWRDLHTTDIMSDDKRFLEIRLTRLADVTFAPCARLKRDLTDIGANGGHLVSLADSRISLNVPPGSIKADLLFVLQVQQLDNNQLQVLKNQNQKLMANFICCSPLVYLTCATKALFKPITISVPLPEAQSTSQLAVSPAMLDRMTNDPIVERPHENDETVTNTGQKTTGAVSYNGFQKSLLLPQLLGGPRNSNYVVTLMVKYNVGQPQWSIWEDAERTEEAGESMSFNLNRIQPCRFIALKMRSVSDPDVACRCATLLEQSLAQYLVFLTIRQNIKTMQQFCLVLALPDQLESILEQVQEEGFMESDKPHGPIFLNENQQLDLTFNSNIRLATVDTNIVQKSPNEMNVKFSSTGGNIFKFTVDPVDPNSQIGLDTYRGYVDIFCMREVITNIQHERAQQQNNTDLHPTTRMSVMVPRVRKARFKMVKEKAQLARIVLKIPRHGNAMMPVPGKYQYEFEPKDVVSTRYLRELSKKLTGDNWRKLATALDLTRIQTQAIGGKAVYRGEDSGYLMLLAWVKTQPISADRFSQLYRALNTIGRSDLASELREQNMENAPEEFSDEE